MIQLIDNLCLICCQSIMNEFTKFVSFLSLYLFSPLTNQTLGSISKVKPKSSRSTDQKNSDDASAQIGTVEARGNSIHINYFH